MTDSKPQSPIVLTTSPVGWRLDVRLFGRHWAIGPLTNLEGGFGE